MLRLGSVRTSGYLGPTGGTGTSDVMHSNHLPPMSDTIERGIQIEREGGLPLSGHPGSGSAGP